MMVVAYAAVEKHIFTAYARGECGRGVRGKNRGAENDRRLPWDYLMIDGFWSAVISGAGAALGSGAIVVGWRWLEPLRKRIASRAAWRWWLLRKCGWLRALGG
jgi:hypothetical protein